MKLSAEIRVDIKKKNFCMGVIVQGGSVDLGSAMRGRCDEGSGIRCMGG